MRKASLFTRIAQGVARQAGRPITFVGAALLVLLWAVTGPIFGYSDTWQLVINTSTTIITFLMVFLLQNTQNRDTEAMQLKLDELIRAIDGAHNALLVLEDLSEQELKRARKRYRELAEEARRSLRDGQGDTDQPQVDPFGKLD